jgi:hypothetical protein
MSLFAITFRIHYDTTYDERYDSVVKAIKELTTSTYWAEPTSFFLIESDGVSADVANAIDSNSQLAPSKDLLVVINLSQKGYKGIGHITDSDLHKLMDKR